MGKFHPGQKLNAAFTPGAIVVMLTTGSIMHWFRLLTGHPASPGRDGPGTG